MAKIITTLKKEKDADIWILTDDVHAKDSFTQSEIDTVIEPYRAFVKSLQGLVSDSLNQTYFNNTLTISVEFDTYENAKNAFNILYGNVRPNLVNKYMDLVKTKMNNMNLTYSITRTIDV
jgi:hypothetical protein